MEPQDKSQSEKDKPLSDKERSFCEAYTVDWNKTKAAQAAGYSPKNAPAAAVSANRLLKKANVNAYIEECKQDTERLAGISRLRNAQELAAIAYSSIAHMKDTWIEFSEFEELTDAQKASIESIEYKTEHILGEVEKDVLFVKVKLHSKIAALDSIAKMFGYYSPEKFKVESTNLTRPLSPQEAKDLLDQINGSI